MNKLTEFDKSQTGTDTEIENILTEFHAYFNYSTPRKLCFKDEYPFINNYGKRIPWQNFIIEYACI